MMLKSVMHLVVATMSAMIGTAARSESIEEFYRGKTITLSVGYSPGGAYDAVARILAQHMPKYIPGKPTIVVRNVPGAGSLILTNQLYNVVPRDGTQFAIIARGMAMEPLIGTSGAKYDSTKFTWIGSAANEISLCATYGKSPVKSWRDAMTTPFVVAGNGSGSAPDVFTNVLMHMFGMKSKLISSYPGTTEISLAMERGEVDGRCGWSWTSIKSEKAEWLEDKKPNMNVQLALNKAKDLPDVPLIMDFARTEDQRQILRLIFSRQIMGRPFVALPNIPADRRDALRDAFDKTMADTDFLSDANKRMIEINPVSGVAVDQLIRDLYATSPEVVSQARAIIEGGS